MVVPRPSTLQVACFLFAVGATYLGLGQVGGWLDDLGPFAWMAVPQTTLLIGLAAAAWALEARRNGMPAASGWALDGIGLGAATLALASVTTGHQLAGLSEVRTVASILRVCLFTNVVILASCLVPPVRRQFWPRILLVWLVAVCIVIHVLFFDFHPRTGFYTAVFVILFIAPATGWLMTRPWRGKESGLILGGAGGGIIMAAALAALPLLLLGFWGGIMCGGSNSIYQPVPPLYYEWQERDLFDALPDDYLEPNGMVKTLSAEGVHLSVFRTGHVEARTNHTHRDDARLREVVHDAVDGYGPHLLFRGLEAHGGPTRLHGDC